MGVTESIAAYERGKRAVLLAARFDCAECGAGVKVDDDECCASCGGDARVWGGQLDFNQLALAAALEALATAAEALYLGADDLGGKAGAHWASIRAALAAGVNERAAQAEAAHA